MSSSVFKLVAAQLFVKLSSTKTYHSNRRSFLVVVIANLFIFFIYKFY